MSRTVHTFSDHLRELRLRLFVSFLFFVAGGAVAYYLNVPILQAIQHSLQQTLYYTTPAGAFNLAMKISLIGGVVFALPALTYNAAAFVQPALRKRFTKGELRLMTMLTLVLAAGAAAFAYYVVVPMSLNFFQKFDVKGFQSLISATEYVNFVVNCVLIFVVMFQLPLVLLFIDRINPLPPKRLWKFEKFVIIGSLVIALVLPFTYDPLTQFLIALPIIVLYNVSILLIMLSHRAQHRREMPKAAHAVQHTAVSVAQPMVVRPVQSPALDVVPMQRIITPTRSIDGFAPRVTTAVHATPHVITPSSRTVSASPQRVISDFVNQPTVRPAQYHRRDTAHLPHLAQPSMSDIVDLESSRPFTQPAIE